MILICTFSISPKKTIIINRCTYIKILRNDDGGGGGDDSNDDDNGGADED